ncbi:MAG: Crp/Fnr family transcriptional regulator [Proteobacteria bacterium]|nr:Crp/Fnr family transcriptional regulator [Pseudomonadota bacterium]
MKELLIRKMERRAVLTEADKAVLAELPLDPGFVGAKHDIVRQSGRPTKSTLLVSGMCARYHVFADGKRQFTQLHVPGDFVDLHSFLLTAMDHGVLALSDCEIASVPHEAIKRVTDTHPRLTRALWLDTLVDGAIHRQWLARMGRQSSAANLAHLICELCARLQFVGLGSSAGFDVPLRQEDVADLLGLSPVHVNRVLQELRTGGMVWWEHQHVRILDWDRLSAMAEFDLTYLQLEAHEL